MPDKKDDILVGTSGYVFPDWANTFYPRGLKRELWLRYYVEHFSALELNTTFYAVPPIERMEKLAKQLHDRFNLHIKLPQAITHARNATPSDVEQQLENLTVSVAPLEEKGVVKGYLAQFPVSFRPDENNLRMLRHLLKFSPKPLFIEFRNGGWLSEDTEKMLSDSGVGWVVPDAPDLPELTPHEPVLTSKSGYVRLHGRNKRDWYAKDKDRYNYSYSDDELEKILQIAKDLFAKGAGKVFVYFNNCHHGQAAANAKKFAQLIGLLPPDRVLL